MNPPSNIKVQLLPANEYPPGEEWRAKVREAIELLNQLPKASDQWVNIEPIEPSMINRVRSAAHSFVQAWDEEYKLITKYDANAKTFWISAQYQGKEESE